MPEFCYLREILPDMPASGFLHSHTHSCKHTVLLLSASDSTQPLLFLFHRLIAPTEDH